MNTTMALQQYLPFTVLKQEEIDRENKVYTRLQQYLPFTVLKHPIREYYNQIIDGEVATVLTVYGIETPQLHEEIPFVFLQLQQYLSFTVLKHYISMAKALFFVLQQYLPFTVLKPYIYA